MIKYSSMTYRLYGLAPLLCALLGVSPLLSGCDSGSSPPAEERGPLVEAWRADYEIRAGINTAPLVVRDSLVIFTEGDRLGLRRVRDGELVWASPPHHPPEDITGEEFIARGDMVYALHDRQAMAWHLDTGEVVWEYRPEDYRLYPLFRQAVDEAAVYVSEDRNIIRLDPVTGAVISVEPVRDGLPPFAATLSGDTLFTAYAWAKRDAEGQSQGRIAALNKRTGQEHWRFDTPRGGFWRVRPVVEGDRLYAGTVFGDSLAFFALDRQTGEAIWTTPDVSAYAAAYSNDAVFLNMGSRIAALDKQTGQVLWDTNLEAGHGESTLAYLAGYVYHGHESSLYVLDATTGEVVHRVRAPDGSYFWEVGVGAGRVFVQTNRLLLCYEPFDPEAAR